MSAQSRWERYEPVVPRAAEGWQLSTVVEPAALFGANGIRMGPDGRCWICEVRAGSVTAWDAESGALSLVSPIGAPITGPDDLAFGLDDTMYVTEFEDGRVDARRADGTTFTVLNDSPRANGITTDREGRLYVSEFRPDGRILELDPRRPDEPHVVVPEAPFPNAFDRGPDGRLYFQDVPAGTISSVDPDGNGAVRLELDGFAMPGALKFDAGGRLLVSEHATGCVWAVDLASRERSLLARTEPGVDNFCLDLEGRVYIASSRGVVRMGPDGTTVERTTGHGLLGPYGLSLDAAGRLVLSDLLTIVTPIHGGFEAVWHLKLPEESFTALRIAWLGDDALIVTGTGDVRRLDVRRHRSEVLLATGRAGSYHGSGAEGAVAIAPSGDGAIVGMADGTILELDPSGIRCGEQRSGLDRLTALAAHEDVLAACDRDSGTVMVRRADTVVRLEDLGAPEAVAVVGDSVFIADAASRSVLQAQIDGSISTVVEGLPFGFPRERPRGDRRCSLAAGPDGSLTIGCDGDGSIRRLTIR